MNNDPIGATYACGATISSPVNSYPILASLVDPAGKLVNYLVTTNDGLLTVVPATLTVIANNASRAYGATNPLFTASLSGFVNGEMASVVSGSPSLTTSATVDSPEGNYAIVPTVGTLTASNYQFGVFVSGTLTVGGGRLVVGVDNKTRIYGGTNPPFTGTVTGLASNDVITVTYICGAGTSSPVGQYPIVPNLADPGGKLGNYTVTTNNGSLTVGAAPLIVTADYKSRLYGATNPAFTGTLTGLANNDTIVAAYTCQAMATSPVGIYPIVPNLSDAGGRLANYTVTTNQGSFTVAPAVLTVAANSANRPYGGTNPVFTARLSGFVNGETASVVSGAPSLTTTATVDSPEGEYPIIPAVGTLSAANYQFRNFVNGTLTIGGARLVVSVDNKTRLYGAANPTFTGTLTGLASNDVITVDYICSASAGSPAGKYPIVPTLVDLGGKLGNYTVTTNAGTLTVVAAPLLVSADNLNRLYGATNPAFTGTLTGLANNDAITATYICSAAATSPVGKYPIVPSLVDPAGKLASYAVTTNNGTLTVTTAPLVVSADNASRPFGVTNPVFTGTLTGVLNNDPISATYHCSATLASQVGNYPIIPVLADPGGKLANYSVSTNNGALSVGGANATVTLAGLTQTYNGSPRPVTVSTTPAGLAVNVTYQGQSSAPINAGSYPIVATIADTNYSGTTTGTLIVRKADPQINWSNPADITYGTLLGAAQLNATAPVGGAFGYTPPAGNRLNAGNGQRLSATFTPTDTTNYNTVAASANLNVLKAPLTVNADNQNRRFGEANPTFTGSIVGVVNGDNLTVTYSCIATASSPPGTYPIQPSLIDPANRLVNYTVTTNSGTLTVVGVNQAPSFAKGPDKTVNQNDGAQTFANWATAISPGPTNEATQTVTFVLDNNNTSLFATQPAVSATGTLTFTPAPNVAGTATVTVMLKDNGGTANGGQDTSAPQSFTITVQALPTITLNDVTVTAPAEGSTNFVLTVNLSATSGRVVTVNYTTVDGSAQAGVDYTARSGTVSFSPGETAKTIPLVINAQPANQGRKNFSLAFNNPVNGIIGNGRVQVTIVSGAPPLFGDVAIVCAKSDPEIVQIQGYLSAIGLTTHVFDPASLTFEAIQEFDLILWDDLADGTKPLSDNAVGVFTDPEVSRSLYFIGENLASGTANLTEPQKTEWTELTRLRPATSKGGSGMIEPIEDWSAHPFFQGVHGGGGTVTAFEYPAQIDLTTVSDATAEVSARSGNADVLVPFPSLTSADDGGVRTVTQNFLAYNGSTPESQAQRAALFQNIIRWLLRFTCSDFSVWLDLSGNSETVRAGELLTYTLVVNHGGECSPTGVVVTNTFSDRVVFVGTSVSKERWQTNGNQLIIRLGLLEGAESAQVQYSVIPLSAGTITNVVSVTANGMPDPYTTETVTGVEPGSTPPPPTLAVERLGNNGELRLWLHGQAGSYYRIQTSTNLANWQPLTNLVATNANVPLLDPATNQSRTRFYRAVSP
jgi:hypothetical protein